MAMFLFWFVIWVVCGIIALVIKRALYGSMSRDEFDYLLMFGPFSLILTIISEICNFFYEKFFL